MITPLRTQVLVELAPEPTPERGAISVVRLETPASTHARVIAVGEDVRDVAAGAAVVISRLQGIELGGNGLLLIPESAVLATVPQL